MVPIVNSNIRRLAVLEELPVSFKCQILRLLNGVDNLQVFGKAKTLNCIQNYDQYQEKLRHEEVTCCHSHFGVGLTFSVAGLRQNAPQEIKVLMTPGLLLVFYGLALIARKVWDKFGWVKQPVN